MLWEIQSIGLLLNTIFGNFLFFHSLSRLHGLSDIATTSKMFDNLIPGLKNILAVMDGKENPIIVEKSVKIWMNMTFKWHWKSVFEQNDLNVKHQTLNILNSFVVTMKYAKPTNKITKRSDSLWKWRKFDFSKNIILVSSLRAQRADVGRFASLRTRIDNDF